MSTRTWWTWIARAEGLSLLTLFGVAMPLKYLADTPEPVAWVGWAHGMLFLMFAVASGSLARVESRGWIWLAQAAVASLVPGGTFLLEHRLDRA